jgi:hypothetical protein
MHHSQPQPTRLRVIGICGYSGAGKDTAADHILRRRPHARKTAYAHALKEIVLRVFGLEGRHVYDEHLKNAPLPAPITPSYDQLMRVLEAMGEYVQPDECPRDRVAMLPEHIPACATPRALLQWIGTDFIRGYVHEDWHLAALLSRSRCEQLKLAPGGLVVVSDMRFPNEFVYLAQGALFTPVYVDRPGLAGLGTHVSETNAALLRRMVEEHPCGVVLVNDGTEQELCEQIDKLF